MPIKTIAHRYHQPLTRHAVMILLKRSALLSILALSACASGYDPSQPVVFGPEHVIPVDYAVPHLAEALDQRISVSGLPRQREGSCRGVQPLSNADWMLTGEHQCLWVNGRVAGASLLDVRPGLTKEEVIVTGRLIKTDQGVFVLKADRPTVPSAPVE
jgi:hypothetical protein